MVLVGGQFLVPPLATTILRHRLAKDGRVLSVHVSAFPWFELLWQHADSVSARIADYTAAPDHVRDQLKEAAGVGTLDVSIGVLRTGLLTLHDVRLTKHGDELVGVAQLDLADLQSAVPFIRSVTPIHEPGGQLILRGTASVLGVNVSADAVVAARDGRLVVAPTGLLGAFATITLYDDPQIHVQSLTAKAVPGGLRFMTRGKLT